jgi:diguanylate cyclase (GGDEF)-like protein
LEARILSVVDTYVALTSDRQYRRAQAPEVALSTMEREAGKSFDPQIVDAFLRRFVDLESRAESESSGILNLRPPIGRGPTQGVEAPEFLQAIAAVRREEQSLLEFTRILGSSLNLQETLSAMARRFRRLIPFDTMVLYLRKGDAIETCFIEGENYGLFNGLSMKLGEGLSGTVAASRRPALNADPAAEPAAARNPERLARLQAALSIPLDGPQDVVGVLTFYHEKREAYRADHLSLLLAIGPKLAVTVENSIRFSEAESQAAFDFLTGLPNAGSLFLHLQTELARAARTESPLAVLVCDLDGFKQVNDTYGHLTGNKLLQAVGAGLREYCREYDFVARMGGDEFVVVLPGATEDAVQTRRRRLCTMVEDAGKEICERKTVTLSSGTAYFPRDGRTAEDLLSRADALMYEQKAMRKSLRQPLEETAYTQPPQ